MKKALYILVSVFEAALLAGAYLIQYFTRRKMGMARYVVYKNRGWELKYPMELMQYPVMGVIFILTVILTVLYIRYKGQRSIQITTMLAATVFLSALYIGFTLMNGTDSLRAYYFIDGIFALTAFIQVTKALLRMAFQRNPGVRAVKEKKGR